MLLRTSDALDLDDREVAVVWRRLQVGIVAILLLKGFPDLPGRTLAERWITAVLQQAAEAHQVEGV